MSSPVAIRMMTKADEAFVAASWFESFWKATRRAEGVEYELYQPGQDALIRRLLSRSLVTVAAAAEVPDEILGYAVVEIHNAGRVAHYAYVKSVYRRHGIAKGLLAHATHYTHQTRLGDRLAASLGLRYNPYLLF